MHQLARVRLVIAPCFAFQPVLDGLLDLGQPLQAKLDRLEALVGAVAGDKLPQPGALEDVIDRGTTHLKRSASWVTCQQRVW